MMDETSVNVDGSPFGLVALLGATISIVFCYGQILISLVTPLLGMAAFELNIHARRFSCGCSGL
jgi:hypothetical protein